MTLGRSACGQPLEARDVKGSNTFKGSMDQRWGSNIAWSVANNNLAKGLSVRCAV